MARVISKIFLWEPAILTCKMLDLYLKEQFYEANQPTSEHVLKKYSFLLLLSIKLQKYLFEK